VETERRGTRRRPYVIIIIIITIAKRKLTKISASPVNATDSERVFAAFVLRRSRASRSSRNVSAAVVPDRYLFERPPGGLVPFANTPANAVRAYENERNARTRVIAVAYAPTSPGRRHVIRLVGGARFPAGETFVGRTGRTVVVSLIIIVYMY